MGNSERESGEGEVEGGVDAREGVPVRDHEREWCRGRGEGGGG